MKKITIIFLCLLTCFCAIFSTACDSLGNLAGSNSSGGTGLDPIEKDECYILADMTGNNRTFDDVSFCHDDFYMYNVYYIGQVLNVPVIEQNAQSPIAYQGGKLSKSYTQSTSESESIKNAVSKTNTIALGFEAGGNIKVVSVKGSFEYTHSTTSSSEQASEWSKSESTTVTYEFENEKKGLYRMSLFLDLYQFVLVEKNKATEEVKSYSYSTVAQQAYKWEYRESGAFTYGDIPQFDLSQKDFSTFIDFEPTNDNYISLDGESMPIQVHSAEDLKNIAGTNKYVLANDLDLSEENWQPINEFAGILDGNGFSITFNSTSHNGGRGGLISYLNGGIIRNLTIKDSTVNFSTYKQNLFGGMLVGEMKNGAQIMDCKVIDSSISARATEENVESSPRYSIVGGIVGKITSGSVYDCQVTNTTIYAYGQKHDNGYQTEAEKVTVYAGGIAGEIVQGEISGCKVSNSSINAEATIRIKYAVALNQWEFGNVYGKVLVGGIVGETQQDEPTNNQYTDKISNLTCSISENNEMPGSYIFKEYYELKKGTISGTNGQSS